MHVRRFVLLLTATLLGPETIKAQTSVEASSGGLAAAYAGDAGLAEDPHVLVFTDFETA